MKKSLQKPYWEMDARELADATKEFERPTPLSRTMQLSKKEREEFRRAQQQPHISLFIGDGNRLVTVAIHDELLRKSDQYARKHHLTRAEVIARGLNRLLSAAK